MEQHQSYDAEGKVVFSEQQPSSFVIFEHSGIDLIAIGCSSGDIVITTVNGAIVVSTLRGHCKNVGSLRVLADPSHHLVSASLDGSIRAWDIDSHRCIDQDTSHSAWIDSIDLSSDGGVVSGGFDGNARHWSPLSGMASSLLHEAVDGIYCVRSLQKSTFLGLYGGDIVEIVADRKRGRVFRGHDQFVTEICASDMDGNLLVSASNDASIRRWSIKSGKCCGILRGHRTGVLTLFVQGERLFSGSSDGSVRIWNLYEGNCISVFGGHELGSVLKVHIYKSSLYTISSDGKLRRWSPQQPCDFCRDPKACRLAQRCLENDYLREDHSAYMDDNAGNESTLRFRASVNEHMCSFKAQGCDRSLNSDELEEHERSCRFRPQQCQNEGCTYKSTRSRMFIHTTVCEFRCEMCPECHSEIPISLMSQHCNTCPEAQIQCSDCGQLYSRREMQEEHDCPDKRAVSTVEIDSDDDHANRHGNSRGLPEENNDGDEASGLTGPSQDPIQEDVPADDDSVVRVGGGFFVRNLEIDRTRRMTGKPSHLSRSLQRVQRR